MTKSTTQKKTNSLILFLLLPLWLLNKFGEFAKIILLSLFKISLFPFSKIFIFSKIIFSLLKDQSKKIKSFNIDFVKIPKLLTTKKTDVSSNKISINRINKKNSSKGPSFFEVFVKKINGVFSIIVPKRFRLVTILVIFFLTVFFYSFSLIKIAQDFPSPEKLTEIDSPATTEFVDRNGKLLYRLYEGKNRTPVELSKLPKDLINATIAIEDKNFYYHPGFDIFGIIRAATAYVENDEVQGGSTITQQLIKNTMLTSERTFQRKIKEVFLAFWAERVFSKKEILQMYFNEVPYGGPAWGVAAASRTYFNKEVSELDLAESSYLAGLPASPTTYSPYGPNPELGKDRQREVLRRMVEDGYIDQKTAEAAYAEKLDIKSPISQINAPHFVMYVRQLLADKYGEKTVSQGGLKVITSLDLDIQNMAEEIVSDEVDKLAFLNATNGAAMVTDPRNGQILAMVGSKNFFDKDTGNYNVTLALRQPGSSIKPITYATAFKKGYSPGNIILDTPVSFKNPWETYTPVNYDGRFHGPVSIRTALGSSYNIPAVKMLSIVGISDMIQTAKDLGITTFDTPDHYGLSLTLGGGETRMIDMMTAYGTFSQNGTRYDPTPILKVTDQHGQVLEDHYESFGKKVLPSSVAYLISDILSDNKARTPAFGPSSQLVIAGHTVAVKTGTTNEKRDNVAYGYTPEFVVGVWVGNSNNAPMNQALTSGVTGAAPIWNKIMTYLVSDQPDLSFVRPADVTIGKVDGNQDLVISGIPQKTATKFGRRIERQENSPNPEKEVITFTDPFSTFTNDSNNRGNTPKNP